MKYAFLIATLLSITIFVSKRSEAQSTPQSSGALPKLPYVAVHNPEFTSVSQVNFMHPNDRLIGIMVGKVAKAYPAGIVAQHGLVEDATPDGPIAITW